MKAILTFHSIDDSGSVLSFGPRMFADLVQGLLKSGLKICSLDELLMESSDQAVALTFDDGMRSVFQNALPVLRDAGVPAHLFLTTGYVGRDNQWPTQPSDGPKMDLMDWSEIEACGAAGMLVECHTVNHPDLRSLSPEQVQEECAAADAMIEDRLGRKPQHFAYPYGFYNDDVSCITAQRYRSCVTTELRSLRTSDASRQLPRLDSYYLQHRRLYGNLFAGSTRAYLTARNQMRKLKQRFEP